MKASAETFGDGLLRESAVARRLGLELELVKLLREFGRGPKYLKFGRLIRYEVDDVDQWVCDHSIYYRKLRTGISLVKGGRRKPEKPVTTRH
jgi:hypothetical protein